MKAPERGRRNIDARKVGTIKGADRRGCSGPDFGLPAAPLYVSAANCSSVKFRTARIMHSLELPPDALCACAGVECDQDRGTASFQAPGPLCNRSNVSLAIAAGAWSGIANTELTLISQRT